GGRQRRGGAHRTPRLGPGRDGGGPVRAGGGVRGPRRGRRRRPDAARGAGRRHPARRARHTGGARGLRTRGVLRVPCRARCDRGCAHPGAWPGAGARPGARRGPRGAGALSLAGRRRGHARRHLRGGIVSLAIVIVAYNAVAELSAALESLSAAPPSTPGEIVVVDNASTDDVSGLVRGRFPGVRLIEAGANLGFARGVNLGIRNSSSDYVLLLNPDTTVPPGAIDRLVAALQQAPDVGAIGPRLVDGTGRAELSFGRMYSPVSELRRKVWLGMQARGVPFVQAAIERATSRERDVEWVSGACLLVRRSAGEGVGWLDERYFLYAEDVDFC